MLHPANPSCLLHSPCTAGSASTLEGKIIWRRRWRNDWFVEIKSSCWRQNPERQVGTSDDSVPFHFFCSSFDKTALPFSLFGNVIGIWIRNTADHKEIWLVEVNVMSEFSSVLPSFVIVFVFVTVFIFVFCLCLALTCKQGEEWVQLPLGRLRPPKPSSQTLEVGKAPEPGFIRCCSNFYESLVHELLWYHIG